MKDRDQMSNPVVSVVIPARNEARYIDKCLTAIRNVKVPCGDIEVIVVDNGSTDETAHIARTFGARVVIKTDGTIGSLRNFGARIARADVIAFLDADCIVPEDWLMKALTYFSVNRKTLVGFRMIVPPEANWVAQCWDTLFSRRNITSEVDWLPSGNMILPKEAFFCVGGFDESLETNEDYDLSFRLRERGYRIVSSAETSVVHLRPPRSLGQVFKKELWHGKEVFNVFMNDLIRNREVNIAKRKNSKVIFFALYNLLLMFVLLVSLGLSITKKSLLPLGAAVSLIIISSLLLALRYARARKDKRIIMGMTILLMVYGISRGLSILPYDKVAKISSKV